MEMRFYIIDLILPFICPFFKSFKAKFVSVFSGTEQARFFKHGIQMSDCIMGLRLRVMAVFFYFYPFFFLSLYCMLTLKICV